MTTSQIVSMVGAAALVGASALMAAPAEARVTRLEEDYDRVVRQAETSDVLR